jgi:hypothetical protein
MMIQCVYKLCLLVILIKILHPDLHGQQLYLNEIVASNAAGLEDEDGDNPDWIELYHAGNEAINLSGYGLSDDPDDPMRWVFPAKTFYPGQFLIVYASGKNRTNPTLNLHTNFSISAAGEPILLSQPDGQRVDSIGPVALQADIAYGRLSGTPEMFRFFTTPTPGMPNPEEGYPLLLSQPDFSHSSGYYADSIVLAFNATHPDATVYYSTDGSEPNTGSAVATQPITLKSRAGEPNGISMIPTNNNNDPGPPYYEGWQPPQGEVYKLHVIRARQIHADAPPGPVVTLTYIIDELLNERYSLPVFSLATDSLSLFDDDTGIYVHGNNNNYFQDGIEWERTMNLSLFEKDGMLAFSENAGMRTHGNTTRSRPRKSLRVVARAEYGSSWINYQLFPDKEVDRFKRFILRNSGNDWDFAIFRDAFLQSLARNMKVDRQYYRPAILFINGEYWGIHNIRDRYDEHYISSNYGIEEMEMTLMENNGQLKFGNPEGVAHYNAMRSYVSSHNLAQDAHLDELSKRMDIESFTDFQIAHIFSMNTDWPGNNSLYWRYLRDGYDPNALNGRDGRWRWMLLDLDFGFGLDFIYVPGAEQGAAHNTIAFALAENGPNWPNPPWSTFLLRNMVKNTAYRNQFINRFCDLLNTDLKESAVMADIDSVKAMLQPEMAEHIRRWRRPTGMTEWLGNVQVMRNFAQQRPAYMRQHLRNQFNLEQAATLTIEIGSADMGHVRLNSINLTTPYWSGIYFKQIPQQLNAVPKPGFRFVSWSGASTSTAESIIISMTGNTYIKALFEPSNDFPGDSLHPAAWRLANGPYHFTYWDANNPERTFPPNMIFQQSIQNDPGLETPMTHPYHVPAGEYHSDDAASIGYPYRLTRRTRLNGLGEEGISFINTGRGRDLGAAVLAVDTRGLEEITVGWTAATIIPNSRAYAIRLQYRTGLDEAFRDVVDSTGQIIEYFRSNTAGHVQVFNPVQLPEDANHQAYVELRWKYYFTGTQIDPQSGARDMLRLDDIVVSTRTMDIPERTIPGPEIVIAPNPFAQSATIQLLMPVASKVQLRVYDLLGQELAVVANQQLPAGKHQLSFDSQALQPGQYVLVVQTNESRTVKKFMIIR